MKKALFVILGCTLAFASVQAQKGTHVFRASYGDGGAAFIATGLLSPILSTDNKLTATGTFNLGYRYGIGNRLYLGGDVSMQHFKFDEAPSSKANIYMIQPKVEYDYLRKEHFSLYGNAGAGVMFSESSASFAFQVNPIGMRVGGKRIGAFIECGFGMQHLFGCAGIEVRL